MPLNLKSLILNQISDIGNQKSDIPALPTFGAGLRFASPALFAAEQPGCRMPEN